MHRWTARFLLTLLLVSVLTPVGMAISAPAPHACCARKTMHHHHEAQESELRAVDCCGHDCCRQLTPPNWANFSPAPRIERANVAVALGESAVASDPVLAVRATHSGRAPPASSIS
jgi:hypothetical protein